MKKMQSKLLTMLIVTITVLSSCSDDDESVVIEITEEGVADVVASSLSEEDGGLGSDIDNLLLEVEEECGLLETESLNDTEEIGVRTFSIDYEITTEVRCNENNEFIEILYTYSSDREAELIRLDVTSSAQGDWSFSENGEQYLLDGSYTYSGQEEFKIRDENTFNSTSAYISDNLLINEAGDFLDGQMSVEYSIESTSGDQEEFGGTLTITNTNVGLLDINSFDFLYEIDLKTGEVQQIER